MSQHKLENWILEAAKTISANFIKKRILKQLQEHYNNSDLDINEQKMRDTIASQQFQIVNAYLDALDFGKLSIHSIDPAVRSCATTHYETFKLFHDRMINDLSNIDSPEQMKNNLEKARAQKELNSLAYLAAQAKSAEVNVQTEIDPHVTRQEFTLAENQKCYLSIGQGRAKRPLSKDNFVTYQEDRAFAFHLDLGSNTSFKKITNLLSQAFITLGKNCLTYELQGSTCITTIVYQNTLFTAWVGDSNSLLIGKNQNGKYECYRLNWYHSPRDPDEQLRINQQDGFVSNGRLGGSLAVSRAFGDNYLTSSGITFLPSMSLMKIPDHLSEPHLLLCSDGVTDFLDTTTIATLLNNLRESENPADSIRQAAYNHLLNRDNISVLFLPAFDGAVGFLADGHGGANVSDFLYRTAESTLQNLFTPNDLVKTQSFDDENSESNDKSSHSSLIKSRSSISQSPSSFSQENLRKRKRVESQDDDNDEHAKKRSRVSKS